MAEQYINLSANLARLPEDANPLLLQVLADSSAALVPVQTNEIVFTDDRAPVETVMDTLLVDFLLGGGLETLR